MKEARSSLPVRYNPPNIQSANNTNSISSSRLSHHPLTYPLHILRDSSACAAHSAEKILL